MGIFGIIFQEAQYEIDIVPLPVIMEGFGQGFTVEMEK